MRAVAQGMEKYVGLIGYCHLDTATDLQYISGFHSVCWVKLCVYIYSAAIDIRYTFTMHIHSII